MKPQPWSITQARQYLTKKKVSNKPTGAKQKAEIEMVIKLMNIEYVTEHKFSESRNFRFDWAIPSLKIAIEYEGIFGGKSRHTTVTGYTKDTDKYNLAAVEGWTVLRYTAINYSDITNQLPIIIKNKSC